jgi:hypothetical protein
MNEVERLLAQFKDAHRSGGDADPGPLLAQVSGGDRAELEGLIDAYLERAPRRAFDAEAFRESPAASVAESLQRSLAGQSGLWPALLPRLRAQAQVRRADLVAQLAARLGAQAQEDKVASYYHQMEQGRLPASGVSDAVLEALAAVLGYGKEALRSAGALPAPGGGPAEPGAVFARRAGVGPALEGDSEAVSPERPEPVLDEVDRLFRGG